ncbi:hypothetical protein D3C87_1974410 [compost metagenome]
MDRNASGKLFQTIAHAAKGEAAATPAVSVKTHSTRPAANTRDHADHVWFFKALEPGCFLADRWLG